MANLNVAEWSPDQVSDWISGLGPAVARYSAALRERGLDGVRLLLLRCDDLENLGMHIIGHQELLLEAVEHLRHFQYEWRRECVQQLAARAAAAANSVARGLARELRTAPDARLHTQALADVAAVMRAVKPLVCWLDRWPVDGRGASHGLAQRKAQLLQLSLEAATSAQRDRFAEQPARAVAAAAAATAAVADYIVQEVTDPDVLQPGALDSVCLRQNNRPLGFGVVPSFCGHHQLADIRFGSPAHASGLVHDGDEIVQVGNQCVIGWSGAAVIAECLKNLAGDAVGQRDGTGTGQREGAAAGQLLSLRLRRRASRAPPVTRPLHHLRRRPPPCRLDSVESTVRSIQPAVKPETVAVAESVAETEVEAERAHSPSSMSDDSEPLSPPASPSQLNVPHARLYQSRGPPPARRHSVSGGSPASKRAHVALPQFWRELREERRWERGSDLADDPLYRRDKAVSYSTGLELSPRPRTCLGVLSSRSPPSPGILPSRSPPSPVVLPTSPSRGRLDKSHSSPAYGCEDGDSIVTQVIPESPGTTPADSPTILVHSAEKADQILDFKKSSSQIGEAILQQQNKRTDEDTDHESDKERIFETINIAMMEHRRRSLMEKVVEIERVKFFPTELKVHDEFLNQVSSGDEHVPPRVSLWSGPPSPPPRPAMRVSQSTRAPPARAAPLPADTHGHRPAAMPAVMSATMPATGVLRAVPREEPPVPPRVIKPLHASQISLPLRHITKHDIKMIPSERRELPPINADPEGAVSPSPSVTSISFSRKENVETEGRLTLSPSSGVVKSIFPTSKSRSLKKKNSILAKRRLVPARTLPAEPVGSGSHVWHRVRSQQPRWARRHLILAHGALYAFRSPHCIKAECMIYLEGFTVHAATEVKSRPHAFKVYHTGTAFYFACQSQADMLAWIQAMQRATMQQPTSLVQLDISQQFSETDYSETDTDNETSERKNERDRERREEREKEKDKSKFGSLKKLTGRMQRSESQENVSHAATSLDRKYLRFFSRNRSKDDKNSSKNKQTGVPVPTEHYRSYRRVPPTPYTHVSNPNLSDCDPRPPRPSLTTTNVIPVTPVLSSNIPSSRPVIPLLTLEEFMLKKQEEERRQVYTDRVVLGVQRDHSGPSSLQRRLDRVVPDVIYGELQSVAPAPRPRPSEGKLVSVTGKDGYEKLVIGDEAETAVDRWRDSLRRNHKVHSTTPKPSAQQTPTGGDSCWTASTSGSVSRLRRVFGAAPQYPHLVCPPTFQPETYSLARLTPRDNQNNPPSQQHTPD